MRNSTIQTALRIYCDPDETLPMLGRSAKREAIRFCMANGVPVAVIARECGATIEDVRRISNDVTGEHERNA